MDIPFRSTLLIVAVAASAAAQTPAAPSARGQAANGHTDHGAEQALLALENSWAAAVVKRDGATFERLLSPGFIYTEDDRMTGRADVLHDVVAGTDTATSARNEEMAVHLFGTTGVVTGWLVVAGRGTGGPFTHRYRFTDTWVERAGQWKIVAAQDYLVPAKRR